MQQSIKLDKKDRQILDILGQNCRVSHTKIGKAVKLSQESVFYRIRKLEESKVILTYIMVNDVRLFGLTRYMFLLRFENRSVDVGTICAKFNQCKSVLWVNPLVGAYDAHVLVDARDDYHLTDIRNKLFELSDSQVSEYKVLTELHDLRFSQLLPDLNTGVKYDRKADSSFCHLLSKRNFPSDAAFKHFSPSLTDIEVLNALAEDPCAPLSRLGRTTHHDRQTVKRCITRLIKNKVIINFGAALNPATLGYVTYYILFKLKQGTSSAVTKRAFRDMEQVFWAGALLGDYDIVAYLNAKNPQELETCITKIHERIGKYIRHYELLIARKPLFWKQFCEETYLTLKNRAKNQN